MPLRPSAADAGRTADIRSLFHRVGDDYDDVMSFEAEMIVPHEGWDDLGQKAEASITFLRYTVALTYHPDNSLRSAGSLELTKEELVHINLGDARESICFPHSAKWRKSVVRGRRTSPFISTEGEDEARVIKLHQDGRSGRTLSRLAANLPRTVLSSANAAETPTALLARREMQSWRLLQLEPSALRRPDEFKAPTRLGNNGAHLPATLYQLANRHGSTNGKEKSTELSTNNSTAKIYAQVANRLAELIDDVYTVHVDPDEKRELLTLYVTGKDRTPHPARALSDGTLRFLALAVVELDPEAQGLLCLEEPENGIHPERIPAMLRLLQDVAVDPEEPVGPENPLRQVIVNTHSPTVVAQVPEDTLLVASSREMVRESRRFSQISFACLPKTWRQKAPEGVNIVSLGQLLAYLNPVLPQGAQDERHRVADRPDLQLFLQFPDEAITETQ